MVYSGLFAAALVSLILTVVSVFFLKRRGPWGSVWTFFLVLFLTLGTVSVYIGPIGPVYWGIAWFPITIAGILITILLIAAMPRRQYRNEDVNDNITKPVSNAELPATPVGKFFWVLVILSVIAIMVGIMNPQRAL
jgi:hypothetical protein